MEDDFLDTEKEKCINFFMKLIEKNNIFKNYYSAKEIVMLLRRNITDIAKVTNLYDNDIAYYNVGNKKIRYLNSLEDSEIMKVLMHEMVHALLRHWASDRRTLFAGALRYDFSTFMHRDDFDGKLIVAISGRGINEGITEVIVNKLFKNSGEKYFNDELKLLPIDKYAYIRDEISYPVQINAAEQLEAVLGSEFLINYAVKGEVSLDEFAANFETEDYKLSKQEKNMLYIKFNEIISDIEEYHSRRKDKSVLIDISSKMLNVFFNAKVKQAKKSKDSLLAKEMLVNIENFKNVFPDVYVDHKRYEELNIDYKTRVAQSILAWKIFRVEVKNFFTGRKVDKFEDKKLLQAKCTSTIQDDEWRKKLGISRHYTVLDRMRDEKRDLERERRKYRYLISTMNDSKNKDR